MRTLLARLRGRAGERLVAAGPDAVWTLTWLVLALVVGLGHYLVFCLPQPWYIEDAAISFAYARNWVDGHGLVPFVGGERVEGYSNPLWTFLMGGWYAIGVTPWTSSKVMGAVFGMLEQLFAWGLAWRALPEGRKGAALLAPWLLAASTQFALWNASGLENSLFCLLLASGLYFLVVEVEDDKAVPWSAPIFFLLTMTRPDGLAYAGIGLIGRTMGTVAKGQWKAWLLWVVAFAVPYAGYWAIRFDYFGWEWPQTWYAKKKEFKPFDYANNYGWKQMREYFWKYGILWATPLLAIGVAGFERSRKWLVLAVLALFAGVLIWDGRAGIPTSIKSPQTIWLGNNWNLIRVYVIAGGVSALGLLSFGQPRWLTRGLLWTCLCFGLFYTILATGDWMKGLRWYSLTSVPLFTLIAIGLGTLSELLPFNDKRLRGRLTVGGLYMLVPTIALGAANIPQSYERTLKPETAPRDVHKRVEYMRWVQSRLSLERVTLLDVDMGAHMWYSDWFIADIAGLVDVPMAQHEYEVPFVKEYLFNEVKPDFAHVHGSWARTLGISKHDEWKEQYVEIPGYPSGRSALHVGNHVRKSLLVRESPPASSDSRVRFGDNVRMEEWLVPAPVVAPGGELRIESTWRAKKRESGLHVVLFLARDGAVAWSGQVTPGYDWYVPARWQPWEYVYGNWSVAMPKSLPEGEYQLGMVLIDQLSGVVLPFEGAGPGGEKLWADDPEVPPAVEAATDGAAEAAPPAEAAPASPAPVYAIGEYIFPTTVKLTSRDQARAAAEAKLASLQEAVEARDCDGARDLWRWARAHVVNDPRWTDEKTPFTRASLVTCLLAQAERIPDDVAAAAVIAEARKLSPKDARVYAAGAAVGQRLEEKGAASAEAKDWLSAFEYNLAAVTADPSLAKARRRAEDARDRRLRIRRYDPKSDESLDPDEAPFP